MKSSKTQIQAKFHKIPTIQFADQQLTSFSGLVVFQVLFSMLDIKARLKNCFSHLKLQPIFGHHIIVLLLIINLILGGRRLRDTESLRDDPMLLRLLGLRRLPDVSTISRALAAQDEASVSAMRNVVTDLVVEDVRRAGLDRLTLDFDGSVQSTTGHVQGTAVGYNPKKKGARSYYPLFCTLAQTGQFFDFHHRPGNVHDSNGAFVFFASCFSKAQREFPNAKLESRMDSAFFDKWLLFLMEAFEVEFTASVAFTRLPELKGLIEQRKRWKRIDNESSYFEKSWKPKSWKRSYRFIFVRKCVKKQQKGPLQLDLFKPADFDYEYKVIVTSKTCSAKSVILFHNGRGAQEAIFGESKNHAGLDVIAVRRLHGNQIHTICSMLAHNLGRTLQMLIAPKPERNSPKHVALWVFENLASMSRKWLGRAGRLVRPQGNLVLSMNTNGKVKREMLRFLDGLQEAEAA